MAEKVTNPTCVPKDVTIVLANGQKDVVFVQPSSKVTLPPGARVDPSYKERNRDLLVKTV